jgi:peptide/nickel transport system ATP-binding protein
MKIGTLSSLEFAEPEREEGPVVQCDRLYKIHRIGDTGVAALGGITLRVARGEFVAVVGPSGSGKSTLLSLVGALDVATAGVVSVEGRDLGQLSGEEKTTYRRDRVGFVWQGLGSNLVPYLTVEQNVLVPQVIARQRRQIRLRRTRTLLRMVRLQDRAHHFPPMLSGGEQQRAAIAVALANNPPILLADEPTAEIDVAAAEQVLQAFRLACQETGTSVIMATHDLLAAGRADRVLRLVDGRLRPPVLPGRSDHQGNLELPSDAVRLLADSELDVELDGVEVHIRRREPPPDSREALAQLTSDFDRPMAAPLKDRRIPVRPPTKPPTRSPDEDEEPAPAPAQVGGEGGPLLQAQGLVRIYAGAHAVTALDDVEVQMRPGEFLVVMGPSGSGKSTLLGLLAGLDRADAGGVLWRDRPIWEMTADERSAIRCSGLGIVLQSLGLLPSLSALENVQLSLLASGRAEREAREEAVTWLSRLGMADHMHHRLFELSAGQQQRVAVARALSIRPEVVLADEPTAELDAQASAVVLTALEDVVRTGGAVLVATHDPSVLSLATRALLLRDGRLEHEGPPEDMAQFVTTD